MTMTKISTVEVGAGGAANITFSSIPQTYTDLLVVLSARSDTSDAGGGVEVLVRPNGATTNLSQRVLYGVGSGVGSGNTTAKMAMVYANPSNSTASTFANGSIYIPNYAGSTNKSFSGDSVTENNGTTSYQGIAAGLWSSTSAITSLVLLVDVGNFVQYSSATLYGVLKGSGGATVS